MPDSPASGGFDARSVLDALPSAWAYHRVVVDEAGEPTDYEYLAVNDVFEQATGLTRDLVLGRRVTEVIPTIRGQDPDLVAVFGAVGLGGPSQRFDTYFAPLGRWYSIHAFSDREGYFGVLFTDVTERKEAEEIYRTVVALAFDGYWVLDAEGRFLEVNDAYCEMTGFTREELLGMSLHDIEVAEEPRETRARMARLAERGASRFETQHRTVTGSERDVEIGARYADVDGGRFYVFVRDITDRKLAERELAAANARLAARVDHQEREILELSTPVIEIWDGVVVAPLIGALDSSRTLQFMERLLETVASHGASIALVDITGVPTVDTATAQCLIETVTAVRLLGARVSLTGIRPAIARTLVALGIDLSGVDTFATLRDGLRTAIAQLERHAG